ncbi:MAG: hypothetical protein E6556_18080, partial [Pantoea sp.]|nr:hypothetical protein [Pantoea sp.]
RKSSLQQYVSKPVLLVDFKGIVHPQQRMNRENPLRPERVAIRRRVSQLARRGEMQRRTAGGFLMSGSYKLRTFRPLTEQIAT